MKEDLKESSEAELRCSHGLKAFLAFRQAVAQEGAGENSDHQKSHEPGPVQAGRDLDTELHGFGELWRKDRQGSAADAEGKAAGDRKLCRCLLSGVQIARGLKIETSGQQEVPGAP